MEYISVRETADKWGVSARRVQYLCSHDMIPGAVRFGKVWAIPKQAEKPRDGRYKNNGEIQSNVALSSQSLCGNEELLIKIMEFFPFPIQVFTSHGTVIITNEAFLKVFKIPSKDIVNGKYNIFQEPDLETWGVKEYVLRAFKGEFVQIDDLKVPVKELTTRFSEKTLGSESIFQNITCFPVFNDHNQLSNVVAVFIISRAYRDREEIIKGKEYLESRWQEKFNVNEVAGAVNLSKYHFARLFKKHTGMTLYGYYMDIRISKLKEKLCDLSLSISQAFAECGVDYSGNSAKIFKEKVGMTPSQYRASVTKK